MQPGTSLKLYRFACGSQAALDILRQFKRSGGGRIVSTSPTTLRQIASHLGFDPDESELELLEMNDAVRVASQLKEIEPMAQASHALCVSASKKSSQTILLSPELKQEQQYEGFHRKVVDLWQVILSHGGSEEDLARVTPATGDGAAVLECLVNLRIETRLLLSRLHRAYNGDILTDFLGAPIVEGNAYGRWLFLLGEEASPLDAEFAFHIAECAPDVWVLRDDSFARAGLADPLEPVFGDRLWESHGEGSPLTGLFGSQQNESSGQCLQVVSAPDLLTEAEMAVRRASKSSQAGESVAIYMRDFEKYGPLLQSASTRLGVSLALPRRQPLYTLPNIQFFIKVLDVMSSTRNSDWMQFFNSPYLGVRHELVTDLQKLWETLEEFEDNEGAPFIRSEIEWVAELWQWRKGNLGCQLPKRDWVDRIQSLGQILPWFLEPDPENRFLTEREERAKTKLIGALVADASIESLENPKEVDWTEVVKWVKKRCELTEITHPWDPYGIPVWDKPSVIAPVDHLIVLGLGEGTFPQKVLESPLLKDQALQLVSEKSGLVVPLPTSQTEAEAERAMFLRVVAAAGKKLTVSYPSFENERKQAPARYLMVLMEHLGVDSVETLPRSHGAIPQSPPWVDYESAVLDGLKQKVSRGEELPMSPATVQRLRLLSQSPWDLGIARRIETCHFQAFARDLVRVHPNDSIARFYQLLDLPTEVGLVGISDEVAARQALEDAFARFLDGTGRRLPNWEVSLLRSGMSRLIEGWLRREMRARVIWRKNASEVESPYVVDPGVKAGLRARVTGKYVQDDVVTLVSYQSSVPYDVKKVFQMKDGLSLTPLALASNQAIRQLGVPHSEWKPPVFAIEVDFSQTEVRYLFGNPRPSEVSDAGSGLKSIGIDPGEIQGEFKILATDLKEWANGVPADTNPGEHCSFCSYGELCRAHHVYGERS